MSTHFTTFLRPYSPSVNAGVTLLQLSFQDSDLVAPRPKKLSKLGSSGLKDSRDDLAEAARADAEAAAQAELQDILLATFAQPTWDEQDEEDERNAFDPRLFLSAPSPAPRELKIHSDFFDSLTPPSRAQNPMERNSPFHREDAYLAEGAELGLFSFSPPRERGPRHSPKGSPYSSSRSRANTNRIRSASCPDRSNFSLVLGEA